MNLGYRILIVFIFITSVICQQCAPYNHFDVFLDMCPVSTEDMPASVNNTPIDHKPLVSFEEWQKRLFQNEKHKNIKRQSSSSVEKPKQVVDSIDGGFSDDFGSMLEGFIGSIDKKSPNVYTEGEYISPTHASDGKKKDVRIKSLKERFNYASIDCAATVRKVNKQAKGAQSILYESKDQYLLNKCAADKFVIINLCEQIVVDTIVMANFEFFSSTFKDFKVYASSKYPTEDWKLLGQWQARNTRDLQVFRVPDSGFVEYLKIEFLTHYGREYYCPLSLVRVHGMTMMEYWTVVESQNQEPEVEHLWPAEVREQIIQPQFDATNTPESFPIKIEADEEEDIEPTISPVDSHIIPDEASHSAQFDPPIDQNGTEEEAIEESSSVEVASSPPEATAESTNSIPTSSTTSSLSLSYKKDSVSHEESAEETAASGSLEDTSTQSTNSSVVSRAENTVPAEANHSEETVLEDEVESATTASQTTTPPIPTPPKIALHTKEGSTQESIYKTIMKRLSVLEHDMELSQRFLDDQNKILNNVFVDMEKKHQEQLILLIGHLNETASQKIDNMKRRYEQWYEDLKEQNENDMREMAAKMSILADQLTFERRVSVSQLVILITIFVFMAFSRGTFSTLSPVMAAQQEERKRRESVDQVTVATSQDAVVPNVETPIPKIPNNPRRHSDSPYHLMSDTDLHSSGTRVSRTNSIENESQRNRNLSRHASSDSLKIGLQSELLQKKLDDILIEQEKTRSTSIDSM